MNEEILEGRALELYVATQVALADPVFWSQYSNRILGIEPFPSQHDRMRFDLEIWHPKIIDLRKKGKISDLEKAQQSAKKIVSALLSEAQLFGLAQKVAAEDMPK